jgi:hypothetical protein
MLPPFLKVGLQFLGWLGWLVGCIGDAQIYIHTRTLMRLNNNPNIHVPIDPMTTYKHLLIYTH